MTGAIDPELYIDFLVDKRIRSGSASGSGEIFLPISDSNTLPGLRFGVELFKSFLCCGPPLSLGLWLGLVPWLFWGFSFVEWSISGFSFLWSDFGLWFEVKLVVE